MNLNHEKIGSWLKYTCCRWRWIRTFLCEGEDKLYILVNTDMICKLKDFWFVHVNAFHMSRRSLKIVLREKTIPRETFSSCNYAQYNCLIAQIGRGGVYRTTAFPFDTLTFSQRFYETGTCHFFKRKQMKIGWLLPDLLKVAFFNP